MISFNKPEKLDGFQLNAELIDAGIKLRKAANPLPNQVYEAPSLDGNGVLWLNIEQSDADKATEVVAAHIAKDPEPKTLEQKLASVGLNLDDLKAALGL
jgi:hypothetical protein